MTWPATADSAISVAANTSIDDGDIDPYSGWGPRHDGRSDVDITAPGRYVFSADPFFPGDFSLFSGTSGAGPHVAGAAALLSDVADEPRHPGLQMAAHPNPFNPSTTLRFNLPVTGGAQLRVFDVSGREVWRQVTEPGAAGWRESTWNGTD